MATTSSLWCRIAAALLSVLLLHGSEVAAPPPSPPVDAAAAATACYNSCEDSWAAWRNTTGTNPQLLARYQNSSERAVDAYCRSALNVSACFSACKDLYSQFLYKDNKYILGQVTTLSSNCFTDEAQCRIQDSELWCSTYNTLTCEDIANSYGQCYVAVQDRRGCNLSNSTRKSQRMVLAKLVDNVLYCLNYVDSSNLAPDKALSAQTCQQYIPTVCLSSLTDPATGSYNPYYDGYVTCSDIDNMKECIGATLTQTITVQDEHYAAMCQSIPNYAVMFPKLLDALNGLMSCSQATIASNFTSVTGPTTGEMTEQVSTNTTTKNSAASQTLYSSTNPIDMSTVDTKTVTVGVTKQSSTTPTAHCASSPKSSGLPTSGSFYNVFLSTSIVVILSFLHF